ncbi:MAG: hypothetical protein PHU81_02635 [Acidobacteriota bacterium]|nr:hypothetical protein [Acidobacteriota bacterium]
MAKKSLAMGVLLCLLVSIPALAAKKINIPKGATIEKIGSGHFWFLLPDKKAIEITGMNIRGKSAGFIGIYDSSKNNKVIATSNRITLKSKGVSSMVRVPKGTQYIMIDDDVTWLKAGKKIPRGDYVLIDDDVVWLPIEIIYEPDKR